jgi:hypothetical protein
MILKRFRRNSDGRNIRDLYGAIVAQARSPVFYTDYGVPDTVEGRFELIVLHIVLLLARLDRGGDLARGFGQELFDLFCRDLDANLREMGVGDFAVPKRMRRFGEAFYGRQAAYLAAMRAPGSRQLEKALGRNIFHGIDGLGPRRLGSYVRDLLRQFEAHEVDTLLRGTVAFPKPEAIPMPEPKSRDFAAPWRIPVVVGDIAEGGQHFDFVADAPVRSAVAEMAGLRELPRFEANFDVTRRGSSGLRVTGSISATVGQNCVVTLEPLANEVQESIDLIFEPSGMPAAPTGDGEGQRHPVDLNGPEPLVGGVVDLGAIATEFLILGLDPYPRKPGAVFEAPEEARRDQGPFAALGRLAKRQEGS